MFRESPKNKVRLPFSEYKAANRRIIQKLTYVSAEGRAKWEYPCYSYCWSSSSHTQTAQSKPKRMSVALKKRRRQAKRVKVRRRRRMMRKTVASRRPVEAMQDARMCRFVSSFLQKKNTERCKNVPVCQTDEDWTGTEKNINKRVLWKYVRPQIWVWLGPIDLKIGNEVKTWLWQGCKMQAYAGCIWADDR